MVVEGLTMNGFKQVMSTFNDTGRKSVAGAKKQHGAFAFADYRASDLVTYGLLIARLSARRNYHGFLTTSCSFSVDATLKIFLHIDQFHGFGSIRITTQTSAVDPKPGNGISKLTLRRNGRYYVILTEAIGFG